MESLTSGTLAGTGSFRCEECGYVVTLAGAGELPACPGCAGSRFVRASLFSDGRFAREEVPERLADEDDDGLLAAARAQVPAGGTALAWTADGELHVVPVEKEWTRIGRSLAADVRFDDPTVSRRHALLIRQADGVRVVDDRSLNGVFVNGSRVEWHALADGDDVVVGRYRLRWLEGAPEGTAAPGARAEA